jgi:excisionase family DNA binding protein
MGLLSTAQAAVILGVNDSRVRQLVREGKLPAQQIGRAYLIDESDLALVADRKPGRPAKAEGGAMTKAKAAKKPGAKAAKKSSAK